MPMTLPGDPIDQRTDALDLPLPHIDNQHEDDVPRLRQALQMLDTAMELMGLDMEGRDGDLSARVLPLEWTAQRPTAVAYTYDEDGRVTQVDCTVGGVLRQTLIGYDTQGRPKTVSFPVAGGLTRTHSYAYDVQGRVSTITSNEEESA